MDIASLPNDISLWPERTEYWVTTDNGYEQRGCFDVDQAGRVVLAYEVLESLLKKSGYKFERAYHLYEVRVVEA